MSTNTTGIENVSDTARWVAVYRAMETERPDAHFRDPWARRLAGEKGEAIVQAMPRGRQMAWAMIVRTAVFDRVILERVRERGADMVVNLAAGLDTRAWRLDLPPTLRWVDVDLPGILHYKTALMQGEPPRCRYEAVAADLTDAAVRDALFARLGAEARNALVVAEGLLVYLEAGDVGNLAAALHAQPSFRWWLVDLASPRLLQWMLKSWGRHTREGNAPFRFAPAEGTAFFERFGWREQRWFNSLEEARRLGREMRGIWFWRLLTRLAPRRRREEMRRFSGFVLLERT
jgi:methyltransferase (TIGR00027 family)